MARTAANVDHELDRDGHIEASSRGAPRACTSRLVNDADAAGIAETTSGSGKRGRRAWSIVVTLGTGIGTALIYNGGLIPNSEGSATWSSTGRTTSKKRRRVPPERMRTSPGTNGPGGLQRYFSALEALLCA